MEDPDTIPRAPFRSLSTSPPNSCEAERPPPSRSHLSVFHVRCVHRRRRPWRGQRDKSFRNAICVRGCVASRHSLAEIQMACPVARRKDGDGGKARGSGEKKMKKRERKKKRIKVKVAYARASKSSATLGALFSRLTRDVASPFLSPAPNLSRGEECVPSR